MEPIFQFVAFGVWSTICFVFGAAAGYLVRYCSEAKSHQALKMSGKGCKPQSNSARCNKGGHGRATGTDADRRDKSDSDQDPQGDFRHEADSNLGFDLVSEPPDTSAPTPPVPETVMPPPPPHPVTVDYRRRDTAMNGWLERGPNVPMYFTDTVGTRVHARADCKGFANRKKDLVIKATCSWCCGGVMVVP